MTEIVYHIKAFCVALSCTVMVYAFSGCAQVRSVLAPPVQYIPSQQFGDSGATPCMTGNCIAVHQHKALPACQ